VFELKLDEIEIEEEKEEEKVEEKVGFGKFSSNHKKYQSASRKKNREEKQLTLIEFDL
jgi:hypothetical protein